jgi:hypothetical protein
MVFSAGEACVAALHPLSCSLGHMEQRLACSWRRRTERITSRQGHPRSSTSGRECGPSACPASLEGCSRAGGGDLSRAPGPSPRPSGAVCGIGAVCQSRPAGALLHRMDAGPCARGSCRSRQARIARGTGRPAGGSCLLVGVRGLASSGGALPLLLCKHRRSGG